MRTPLPVPFLSAGGAESMIVSARAKSIILLVVPAESMILSVPPERQWATPAAQWVVGHEAIALGNGTAVALWTAQYHRSGASDKVTFLYFQTCVFFCSKVSHPPLTFATLLVFPSK
jgi:hypothetical protein